MELALAVPLIVTVLLGTTAARLSRAMRPSTSVRLLPLGGVLAAMATGFSLTVIALFLLARAAQIASLGHWSPRALPNPGHLPWPVGVPVAVLVAVLLLAAATRTTRAGHRLWVADGLCRRLAPTLDERTVVIDDEEPDAYAVPGFRGRIVISTAMLAALSEPERRVLLAHERAHLAHRHHLWIQLSEIAAAANPLLRPLPVAVRLAAERWADEEAAAEVGDRRIAAHAIARAALARNAARLHRGSSHLSAPALAATGSDVPRRVRALLSPPRLRWSSVLTAVLTVMIAGVLATSAVTAHTTEQRFEYAQSFRASSTFALHFASPAQPPTAATIH